MRNEEKEPGVLSIKKKDRKINIMDFHINGLIHWGFYSSKKLLFLTLMQQQQTDFNTEYLFE